MRKFCCLLLLFFSLGLSAQERENVKPEDKKQVDGLTVVLKQAPHNSFLFDILDGPVQINIASDQNPATGLKKGFASREDAFKVAQWMIKQYRKDKYLPSVVPPHVLDELKIN